MGIVSIRLDADSTALAGRLAREEGKTRSEVLREALREYGRRKSKTKARSARQPRPYDLMKDLIGVCHSGRTDLSVDTGRKYTEMLWERKRTRDADRRRTARRAG
ncbi:MAG: ribbon-helix-helix domain-containing protein [Candidatus Binataceae bacterium]